MRLFTAIELPDPVRRHLTQMQQRMRPIAPNNASWTREQNLHITLKFIGDVPDDRVDDLCRILRSVEPVPRIALRSRGLVLFPPRGPVRILASGFDGNVEKLAELNEKVQAAGEAFGIARENRVFMPHATLARARAPITPSLRARLLTAAGEEEGPDFVCSGVVLMMSELHSTGSRYTPVARFSA